jgi:hypothetical protein
VALGPASGGGGSAGDIQAGGATIMIAAKGVDLLKLQLADLKVRALAFAASMSTIGRSLGLLGGAGLAPIAALFKTGLNRAESIDKEAEALGYTIVQYQRLKYAADVAGVSIEKVMERPDKYGALAAGAPIMDAQTIREAVQAQQAMRAALIDLQTAAVPLVSSLVPVVKAVSAFVREYSGLLRVLAVGAAGVAALGVSMFAVGKALAVVGVLARSGSVLVGLLFAGLKIVWAPGALLLAGLVKLKDMAVLVFTLFRQVAVAAFAAVLTKAGILFAGVATLGALIIATMTGGRRLLSDLGGAFSAVGQTFSVMLKGIIDAIQAGEFDKAFKVFTAGIEAVWYEMLLNMARAFSTFIENNRDRLIALGGLIGGLKGAGIGGRFGPWGAIIGGAAGAAGGGVAVDQLAKLIEGIATNTGLEAMRANAQDRLKMIVGQGNPNRLEVNEDSLPKRITATRGAFRKLLDGNQQFGASDRLSQNLNETQKQALAELKKQNVALYKLLDAMRFE